jgi:hypothetical protein
LESKLAFLVFHRCLLLCGAAGPSCASFASRGRGAISSREEMTNARRRREWCISSEVYSNFRDVNINSKVWEDGGRSRERGWE